MSYVCHNEGFVSAYKKEEKVEVMKYTRTQMDKSFILKFIQLILIFVTNTLTSVFALNTIVARPRTVMTGDYKLLYIAETTWQGSDLYRRVYSHTTMCCLAMTQWVTYWSKWWLRSHLTLDATCLLNDYVLMYFTLF